MIIVASVPHSGSRSLLKHLKEPFVSSENLWHFGYHDHLIAAHSGSLHIPLRNPVDILISWENRGKPLLECLRCMEKLADYDNPMAFVYKVEDLEERVGHRPNSKKRSFDVSKWYLDWAQPKVIRYYEQHGGYQV